MLVIKCVFNFGPGDFFAALGRVRDVISAAKPAGGAVQRIGIYQSAYLSADWILTRDSNAADLKSLAVAFSKFSW